MANVAEKENPHTVHALYTVHILYTAATVRVVHYSEHRIHSHMLEIILQERWNIEMGFSLPVKCSINLSFMLMSLGTISETKRQKDSVNVFATTPA